MSPRLIDAGSLKGEAKRRESHPVAEDAATVMDVDASRSGRIEVDACAAEDSGRKRRGLAIFAVLIALMLACAAAFFMSSKHLTMAAAFLDETVGTMESYTVVVFKGTSVDEDALAASSVTSPSSAAEGTAGIEATGTAAHTEPGDATSSASASSSAPQKEGEQLSTLPPSNTMQEAFSSGSDSEIKRGFEISEFIMSLFARASKQTEANAKSLYVSDINDIYSSKGASTITIAIDDLSRYSEPAIYAKGSKTLAIFSVEQYVSRAKLNSMTRSLRDKGADFIIAIAPRTKMISTFDDIDACIVTSADDEIEDRAKRKTLVAASPIESEVGALIITSNNVANLKTIKEL